MTPKLTDEQIIKAYEICNVEGSCNDCPAKDTKYCDTLPKDIFDLINRLKAKNLQLNSDLIILENYYEHLKQNFDETVEKNKRLRMKLINAVNTIAGLKRLLKRNGG